MTVTVRAATPADLVAIAGFIRDLAVYEKLEHQVVSTPESLGATLFADNPRVFCDIAEVDGVPAGIALWFYNYSTFLGRHGLYLEDIFVTPAARGRGAGKALLVHLARRCVAEGLGRFEWAVLDWNRPAIDFYEAQGARINSGWLPVRMEGEAIARLAAGEVSP